MSDTYAKISRIFKTFTEEARNANVDEHHKIRFVYVDFCVSFVLYVGAGTFLLVYFLRLKPILGDHLHSFSEACSY